jgi:hypothetical protein
LPPQPLCLANLYISPGTFSPSVCSRLSFSCARHLLSSRHGSSALQPLTLCSPVPLTASEPTPVHGSKEPFAPIPFRIRTYEKRACNFFRIRTYKTRHLKSFRICTYEKKARGRVLLLTTNPTRNLYPGRQLGAKDQRPSHCHDSRHPRRPPGILRLAL